MARATSRPEPLDRSRIVAAAIELADDEGVGAFSMRQLAARLGCGAMSLYNHVADKDELCALMVDAVAAEIVEPPPDAPALDAIRGITVSTRQMFVAHPWAPELWLRCLPGPCRMRGMEVLLRCFAESGLSPDLAHHGFHAVSNHVIGYTLQELGMTMEGVDPRARAQAVLADFEAGGFHHSAAHLRVHLEGNSPRSFELVLDLILDGLVRLDRSRARPSSRRRA